MKSNKLGNVILLLEWIAAIVCTVTCMPIMIFSLADRAVVPLALTLVLLFATPTVWLIRSAPVRRILRITAGLLLVIPISFCLYLFLGLFVFGWLRFL